MIDYSPFWDTLSKSNENWYTLTSKHHLSHSTLHRLKHNMDISMKTVNDLCRILNCQIQDICQYIPSDDDQTLWKPFFLIIINIINRKKGFLYVMYGFISSIYATSTIPVPSQTMQLQLAHVFNLFLKGFR